MSGRGRAVPDFLIVLPGWMESEFFLAGSLTAERGCIYFGGRREVAVSRRAVDRFHVWFRIPGRPYFEGWGCVLTLEDAVARATKLSSREGSATLEAHVESKDRGWDL